MKCSTSFDYERSISRSFAFQSQTLSTVNTWERKNRWLSVACYFGLAPLLWVSGSIHQQRNRVLTHHVLTSLAFSFLLFVDFLFEIITDKIQYWWVVNMWNPTIEQFKSLPFRFVILCEASVIISAVSVSLFVLSWLVSVIGAWRGLTPYVPIISWIATKFQALRLAVYWSVLIEVFVALFVFLCFRSIQISSTLPEQGNVYILYTQGGYIPVGSLYDSFTPPRWAVTLAFYPLVEAAQEKYGANGVAILPLSEDSFNQAIHNGRFVFVASHGGWDSGSFTISDVPYKEYLPTDVNPSQVGPQLEYAYFAGCWTGDLESQWRQILGLEDAKMFPRLSFVSEHMLWIWFQSPKVIAQLN